jgi:hypothetical protein
MLKDPQRERKEEAKIITGIVLNSKLLMQIHVFILIVSSTKYTNRLT